MVEEKTQSARTSRNYFFYKKTLDLHGQKALYYSMIDIFIYNPFAWIAYLFIAMIALSYCYCDDDDY